MSTYFGTLGGSRAPREELARAKLVLPHATSTDNATRTRIEAACRYIEAHADESVTLARLGEIARMSPFHLQRRFKSTVGVTPRAYGEAVRLRALKSGLRAGATVTDAIYAAGFGSASRVYERTATRLGMTPGRYRSGARDVEISFVTAPTALGTLLLAATDRGICAVQLGDDAGELARSLAAEFPRATITPSPAPRDGQLALWMRALSNYLAGRAPCPELPLDIRGTGLQMQVWRYLQRIPAGETRSYAQVARAIGRPSAVRAVASACARNRVALLIPCHRVLRGDGALAGYRWGVERKRDLLAAERKSSRTDRGGLAPEA